MFGTRALSIAERIAAFSLMTGLVLSLTVDQIVGRVGLNNFLLPEIFKSKALIAASLDKLDLGRDEEATAIARLAVTKQPLSVDALFVLAGNSARVKPLISENSLVQAAKLGWRNAAVQAVVVDSAASAGEWEVVAPRLVALTKMGELGAVNPTVFGSADPRIFVPRVSPAFSDDGSAWFRFINWLRDNELKAESEYAVTKTPLYLQKDDCMFVGAMASKLVREGKIGIAEDLIRTRCRDFLTKSTSGLTINDHFGDDKRGPFEWQTLSHGGVSFKVLKKEGKARVNVRNADPLSREVASKVVRREIFESSRGLSFSRIDANTQEVMPLQILGRCIGSLDQPLSGLLSAQGARSSCEFVKVTFTLPSGGFQIWSNDD